MKKTRCNKCGYYFSNKAGNYKKHYKVCNGLYQPYIKSNGKCKWCNKKFDLSKKPSNWMANHSRWCEKNPKRDKYKKSSNSGKQLNTPEARKKAIEGIRAAWKRGCYDHIDRSYWKGKKHSKETKEKMSKSASMRPARLKTKTINYNGVILESSWELALAKRLDELKIAWIRPDPLQWIDKEGVKRKYYPDFYLLDYDLYLDPKNAYAVETQKEKLDYLQKTLQ